MPEYDEELAASDNIPEMWSRCFRQHLAIEEEEVRASQAAATNTSRPGISTMKSTVFRRESNIIRQDPASDSKRVKLKAANKKLFRSAIELTRRSFVNLVRNPIVLGLRLIIYGGMSLVIGGEFTYWNHIYKFTSFEASHLFYLLFNLLPSPLLSSR